MSCDTTAMSRVRLPGTPESAPWMARDGAWNRRFPRADKEYPMAGTDAGDIP